MNDVTIDRCDLTLMPDYFDVSPRPSVCVFLSPQQIGMDDSKHGGQTYPEMIKNMT